MLALILVAPRLGIRSRLGIRGSGIGSSRARSGALSNVSLDKGI